MLRGSKTLHKETKKQTNKQTNKQTDRQTNRHYENNGHLAVNQYKIWPQVEKITVAAVLPATGAPLV